MPKSMSGCVPTLNHADDALQHMRILSAFTRSPRLVRQLRTNRSTGRIFRRRSESILLPSRSFAISRLPHVKRLRSTDWMDLASMLSRARVNEDFLTANILLQIAAQAP